MARKKSKKKGKKVRVAFRRNRSRPARDKSWTREFHEHGFKDKDTVSRESVVPKGELSRKRTVIEDIDLEQYDLHEGTVMAMRGLYAEVDDGERIWPCTIRRILRTLRIEQRHPVAVGDHVHFSIAADEEGVERAGVIHGVEPRVSQLTRRYAKRVHIIAANVSQVVIVVSVDQPPLKPHLIDRYLVSAHAGNMKPIICINKTDLGNLDEATSVAEVYHHIGYTTIMSSIVTREGLEKLQSCLPKHKTVMVGQSGVGKSSLLNAIQPDLKLPTSEVSEATLKGKHTTATAQLLKLDIGGYVVDTPGVKSYELAEVPKSEYELYFIEFVEHVPHCKFPDCTHIHEEECAVKQAADAGLIDTRRHESYVRMFEEV